VTAPGIGHRGREVTRLQGFSDAVFGFALTLLVVSLEVPRSFDQLWHAMLGLPAFAASFAIVLWIWWEHHEFFRRYGLDDGPTVVLNALLLFVVLFYVYPLKFMFTLLSRMVFGVPLMPAGSASGRQPRQPSTLPHMAEAQGAPGNPWLGCFDAGRLGAVAGDPDECRAVGSFRPDRGAGVPVPTAAAASSSGRLRVPQPLQPPGRPPPQ
jgi:hypothetical protein